MPRNLIWNFGGFKIEGDSCALDILNAIGKLWFKDESLEDILLSGDFVKRQPRYRPYASVYISNLSNDDAAGLVSLVGLINERYGGELNYGNVEPFFLYPRFNFTTGIGLGFFMHLVGDIEFVDLNQNGVAQDILLHFKGVYTTPVLPTTTVNIQEVNITSDDDTIITCHLPDTNVSGVIGY